MNDEMKNKLLVANNISKTYFSSGGELTVLKSVSLEIYSGEIVSIVGPSGVGKSTLLNLLGTLDRPTSGEVYVDGKELFSMDDSELATFRNKKMGFVFQFHHLLPEFSAIENVMLPGLLTGESKELNFEKASGLLDEIGLADRRLHKPSELSGGERQRIAVARALMNDPDLVLADEPSGNLDRENADLLYELIWKLRKDKGQTFVIVTHNEELAEKSDRVIRLVDGSVA